MEERQDSGRKRFVVAPGQIEAAFRLVPDASTSGNPHSKSPLADIQGSRMSRAEHGVHRGLGSPQPHRRRRIDAAMCRAYMLS
jgi:hypothetical protein